MPGKHILNLLNTHGRVIVPELGAFILKGKTIYFNEFLRFNDGVLVDYISEQEKINKEGATKKVTEFVAKIHKQLSTAKSIELEGLGALIVDSNDKIQLKPLDFKPPEQSSVQAGKDSVPREVFFEIEKTDVETPAKPATKSTKKSKSPVAQIQPEAEIPKKLEKEDTPIEIEIEKPAKPVEESKPAKQVTETKETKATPETKTASQPQPVQQTSPTETVSPIKSEHTQVTPQSQSKTQPKAQPPKVPPPLKHVSTPNTRNNGKIWLWALIIIVISVVVYFVFLRGFFKENNVNQNIIISGKNLNDSTTAVDSVNETTGPSDLQTQPEVSEKGEVASKSQTNANLTQTSDSKLLPKASTEKRYYLIAGCFSVEANADKMVHKLSGEGYQAEKFVRANNNLYYVSYSSHTSRTEATREMNRIKAAGQLNVWILNY